MPLNKKGPWKRQHEPEPEPEPEPDLNASTEFQMHGTTTMSDNDVLMSEEGHGSPLRRPAVGYATNGI